MKRVLLIVLTLLLVQPGWLLAIPTTIKPTIKSPTSFAIVIDQKSFDKTRQAVEAYRDVVEKDNLATYIIVDNWKHPSEIREILSTLHNDKKMPLEGAVFVGDIPIPMIRDGQFLSTAFKMDQQRNWQKSSIPSDRYYEDFDLKFDFLKQDEKIPLYFYFSLRPDSPQYLSSDIYSARMKPYITADTDSYQLLEKYLRKVVAERQQLHAIQNLTMARGHGYNSEAIEAWSGEQLALKEQFSNLFGATNSIHFYDFESRFPIKSYLLNEAQREDLDVLLFHHHGGIDMQYLNGYQNGSAPNISIENIKRYLRSKISGADDPQKAITNYTKSLGVPRSWCEEGLDPALLEKDSLYNLELDISVNDIHGIKPNARFVMFDACFNGSFQADDYISGAYVFGDGKTIVAQGNTVNTIQDKWPDEYLGLLNAGLRVGQWGRHVQPLETHLSGDPTFRFVNQLDPSLNLNQAIVLQGTDNAYWAKLLSHKAPDVRAIALRKLYENDYPGISSLLRKTYETSDSFIERMECLKLLYDLDSPDLVEVLKISIGDPYELIRRFSVLYAIQLGNDQLIPAFAKSLLTDAASQRVNYQAMESTSSFDADKLVAEIERQAAAISMLNKAQIVSQIKDRIKRAATSEQQSIALVLDNKAPVKERMFDVTSYRNQRIHASVPGLIQLIEDPAQDLSLRIAATEALSWFTHSFHRAAIIRSCDKLIREKSTPELAKQALKTKSRLNAKLF